MSIPSFRRVPNLRAGEDFSMARRNAKNLARRIEDAWAAVGVKVECIVKPVLADDGRIVCYRVECPDLRNGLPIRRRA